MQGETGLRDVLAAGILSRVQTTVHCIHQEMQTGSEEYSV